MIAMYVSGYVGRGSVRMTPDVHSPLLQCQASWAGHQARTLSHTPGGLFPPFVEPLSFFPFPMIISGPIVIKATSPEPHGDMHINKCGHSQENKLCLGDIISPYFQTSSFLVLFGTFPVADSGSNSLLNVHCSSWEAELGKKYREQRCLKIRTKEMS